MDISVVNIVQYLLKNKNLNFVNIDLHVIKDKFVLSSTEDEDIFVFLDISDESLFV